jgi:hypothetical protein
MRAFQPDLRAWLVLATTLAGTLDLAYAFLAASGIGVSPATVLKVIASGLLGPAALKGGPAVAVLGALLHYLIMAAFAAFALVLARRRDWTLAGAAAIGVAYGAALYVLMNYLVVPLSAAPLKPRTTLTSIAPELLVHMVLVGLPLMLVARLALRGRHHPATTRH